MPYFITAALRISSFRNKKGLVCKPENDAEFKSTFFQRKEAMEPVSFEKFSVKISSFNFKIQRRLSSVI